MIARRFFTRSLEKNPFQGNHAIACGLQTAIDFLQNWQFTEDDLQYLQSLKATNGQSLFTKDFLDYLGTVRFTCDVDAIPEGTVVFPHEPLLRVKGPLLQAQLIESTLLNIINFQTLIATKAARVCRVAAGDPVLEFGMRRAQGPDGALSASRAAYIGGCAATSNVLAGKLFDIPVQGTHAHSWVTAFSDEKSAFAAYAKVMPQNCVLLVDTYDTIQGVKHAIEVGKVLREEGAELRGIRLDSGDMATLSIKSRELLDAAGFHDTKIIASNSLDEYEILKLKQQGAKISVWGVGTHLTTAYDQPALDGVYKLSALKDEAGKWVYKIKLSEQAVKISNPGIYQVRRYFRDNKQIADLMFDLELGVSEKPSMYCLDAQKTEIKINEYDSFTDLLVPIFRQGKLVYQQESIHAMRQYAHENAEEFLAAYELSSYRVGLEKNLYHLKQNLIEEVSAANDVKQS